MKYIKSFFAFSSALKNRCYMHRELIYRKPNLPQLRGQYSIFEYDKKNDIYHYGSRHRKLWKNKYFHKGVTEDHHIIPRQFKNHQVIKALDIDLCCSNNIILMHSFVCKYFLEYDNMLYHKTHNKYNAYVGEILDKMYERWMDKENSELDDLKYEFWLFHKDLENRILEKDDNLPW